jgi:glycosyltransferase involved in cell wall biosynthesis
MKFSLVLATVERTEPVEVLLRSLAVQSMQDFELIVVDQNRDERLALLLARYRECFPLVHLRSSQRGLSRARNAGLRRASGEILAFPDDDCWYGSPTLLADVAARFDARPAVQVLTGRSVDGAGRPTQIRWENEPGWVTRLNVWNACISYTLFLRREVVNRIGDFDESLGVGAGTVWGAGEEIDYVLRALEAGFPVWYDPALRVNHPETAVEHDERAVRRSYLYSAGGFRVLRRYRYPIWLIGYRLARALGGLGVALIRSDLAKARVRWAGLRGSVRGLLG